MDNLVSELGEPNHYGIITYPAFTDVDVLLFYNQGIVLKYRVPFEAIPKTQQPIDSNAFGSITFFDPSQIDEVKNLEIDVFHLSLNQNTTMITSVWNGGIDFTQIKHED